MNINFNSANNNHTEINVTGFKQVETLDSNRIEVYTDGKYGLIRMAGTYTKQTWVSIAKTNYPPKFNVRTYAQVDATWAQTVTLSTNGNIQFMDTVDNFNANAVFFYPLKNPIL